MTDHCDWHEWMDDAVFALTKGLRELDYAYVPADRAKLYRLVDEVVKYRGTLRFYVQSELLPDETTVAEEEARLRRAGSLAGDLQAHVRFDREPEPPTRTDG
jgi:hypothetical protein